MAIDSTLRRPLLADKHASRCRNEATVTCQPVTVNRPEGDKIEVVRMVWCEKCGAADWEVV